MSLIKKSSSKGKSKSLTKLSGKWKDADLNPTTFRKEILAKQSEVDKLAQEVKKGWWAKNRSRLIK